MAIVSRLNVGISVVAGVAALLGAGWTGPARAAAPAGAARAGVHPAAASEQLLNVTATSPDNAWITGLITSTSGTSVRSVVMHWNGTAWSPTPIPDPATSRVVATASTSAGDAWSVGSSCRGYCEHEEALILHWNGKAWAKVAVPNPPQHMNGLSSVSVLSASDAWAAGGSCPVNTQDCAPFILHWNGTVWSRVAAPTVGADDALHAVAATSGANVWAVGGACVTGCNSPLAMRWNGTTWSQAPVPPAGVNGQLFGLAASPGGGAWAAGDYCVSGCARYHSLIVAWNGTAWVRSPSPNAGRGDGSILYAVSATSPGNAWAVGLSFPSTGSAQELIVRWNGTSWTRVTSPSLAPWTQLDDVAATSPANAWAVGATCDSSAGDCTPLIQHWNGKAWTSS
jgi:hypothetical protein